MRSHFKLRGSFNMKFYYNMYIDVLKKNFILAIIAVILLFPTFFIWAGVPVFIVGNTLSKIVTSPFLISLGVSLSGGILFSLYLLPINLKVARHIAGARKSNVFYSFLRLEIGWIVFGAIIWAMVIRLVFQ